MNEIICPHCGKAFKVDEAGYANILKQVRDKEFDAQLHERLELAEKAKLDAVELAKVQFSRREIKQRSDLYLFFFVAVWVRESEGPHTQGPCYAIGI